MFYSSLPLKGDRVIVVAMVVVLSLRLPEALLV